MHISCEKCATTYVLDDALIPPQGAPVQCTKCSHVFVARLPPPPEPYRPAASTVMFGAAAAPPPGQSAIPKSTVMFGAVGAPGAPAAPPPANAPASSTMMFGAVGAPGAPAAPPPANVPASSTMMFGAVGAPGAPAAPAAPAPTNSTMMFGAVGAPGAPAAPAPTNSTMMFGAVGVPGPVPEAPKPPSSTMMFGAVGAPGPVPEAPKPASSTMMFGAVGAPGAPTPEAPAAPAPTSSTMMFGAVGAPAPVAPVPTKTAMFGASQIPGPQITPQSPAKTAMFGAVPAPAPEQVRPAGTMIFGAPQITAAAAVPAPLSSESTVRLGPDDLQRMMGQQLPSPDGAPRHQKTQMFAMSPEDQAAEPPRAVGPSNVSIDPSLLQTLPPDGLLPQRPVMPMPEPRPAPAPVQPAIARGGGQPAGPELLNTTIPNAQSPLAPKPVISPRPQPRAADPVPGPIAIAAASGDDPALALHRQVQRRNRIAIAVIVVALLGAVGLVAFKVLGPKLMKAKVPVATLQAVEAALLGLRNDTAVAKQQAQAQLAKVVEGNPAVLEAHAALVTALVLDLDDQQLSLQRISKGIEERNVEVRKLNEQRTADAEAKAKVLVEEATKLSEAYRPLAESLTGLRQRTNTAFRALVQLQAASTEWSPSALAAFERASGLFHAVAGNELALGSYVRWEAATNGQPDGWGELIYAEHAANARVSEANRAEALKQLGALRARDQSFVRAFVLSARINLSAKRFDAARDDLTQLLALSPQHEVGLELMQAAKRGR